MHTILILLDMLTNDAEEILALKKLFPDCNIQILKKTAEASEVKDRPPPTGKNS